MIIVLFDTQEQATEYFDRDYTEYTLEEYNKNNYYQEEEN